MNDVERDVLDRLIEEGLALYGQGDLDGALVIWERVLSEDPGNAQATSYVDYVRTNYDTLTTEGHDVPADPGPFALAADADPGYVIEVSHGASLAPGTPTALASDGLDAGWDDEAGDQGGTLDLAAASADTFDDATREYDPSMRAPAPPAGHPPVSASELALDEGPFSEKTSVRKRDLGFVQPASPPRRAVSEGDFEAPTREHRTVARDIMAFELDQPIDPPAPSTAPTRELPGTFDALVSAPTRELGLRQLATQPTELHVAPDPRGPTRADIVLPFDPIDARAAQILDAVDEGAPPSEPKDEQTRRRITRLMERAAAWSEAGDLDRAVAAVDLALDEDPNSALAQKLIQRHRETTQHVFLAFLGDLSRQPMLARPLHELASAPISPRAAFLLSRIDGMLSIDEILDVSGMPRLEAYRYLCQLFLRGILR